MIHPVRPVSTVLVDRVGRGFRHAGRRRTHAAGVLAIVLATSGWLSHAASAQWVPGGTVMVSGSIRGWQNGTAVVAARLPQGDAMATVASGTITSDGEVVLTLPADVEPGLTESLQQVVTCAAPDASATRVARLGSLTVVEDGVEYGIARASSSSAVGIGGGRAGDSRASYWYATGPAVVQLDCNERATVWDLVLQPGWNLVVAVIDDRGINRIRTVESVPAAWQWHALDAVRLP